VIGLEVDADHGAELKVDEKQQDVVDRSVALRRHRKERHDRGPHGGGANGEERQVVERVDQQVADRVGKSVDALAQALGPVGFHAPSHDARCGGRRQA
jgi:hypothetical protein